MPDRGIWYYRLTLRQTTTKSTHDESFENRQLLESNHQASEVCRIEDRNLGSYCAFWIQVEIVLLY